METPWELDLERALVSQFASRRDEDDVPTSTTSSDRDDDRAAQLDELTALASIFGDALSGPAAAAARREARVVEGLETDDAIENESENEIENDCLLRFDLDVDLDDDPATGTTEEGEAHASIRVSLCSEEDTSSDLIVGTVSSLPPVRLSVLFPKAYPSTAPPMFALGSAWLSRLALERTAEALDAIWEASRGREVVFSWVEYLRERALRETFTEARSDVGRRNGIEGTETARTLRLRKRDGWRGDDASGDEPEGSKIVSRGVPTSRGPDEASECVLRRDARVRAKRYASAVHFCGVCFSEDVPGVDMLRCYGIAPSLKRSFKSKNTDAPDEPSEGPSSRRTCDHAFCVCCLHQMAKVHVIEGTVSALKCPEPSCGASLAPGAVKEALRRGGGTSEDAVVLFERYEKLTLERGLASMADLVYCPRCEHAVLEDENGNHCARCVHCQYVFCSLCREGWHPGSTCLNPERRLEVLAARARGDEDCAGDDARRRHKAQVADAMALRYVEREGKRCPTCGTGVVKSEGCNKMKCGNCAGYFCYKCGEACTGYEHFREGGACSLFDVEAIAAWEREMNPGLAIAEARERDAHVAGVAVRRSNCPACRQPNFKLGGNNHVGCWSCGQRYCHACRVVVRRGADTRAHYGVGPGKCRQHTND
jgi:E3 ubiquitin-protein ligase RNF14